ncbi:hypothetical protein [Desulfovibrio inopinatus]|uniref:hypothetical protein n=1 Tax=Desulfovibrio inopinatus TaxID=102109 RepID=UPI00042409C7|nr:hypothetical protein [Desulfovibrio inopinatus]
MGKFLQIRVSATTYDPSEVQRAWPRLFGLVTPNRPTPPHEPEGVLELVDALWDIVHYGDLDKTVKTTLSPFVEKALAVKEQLDNALAERRASQADTLTYELEDILTDMERVAPKI